MMSPTTSGLLICAENSEIRIVVSPLAALLSRVQVLPLPSPMVGPADVQACATWAIQVAPAGTGLVTVRFSFVLAAVAVPSATWPRNWTLPFVAGTIDRYRL
jgi:hypothetical protein